MQCKLVSAILLLGLLDTLAVQVYSQPQTANTTYYITLGDRVLPNNSYVLISDIGSDVSAGLQCHHDLDNDTQAGSWYSPYNYKVSTYRYNAIYTETFEDGVALVRHEVRPVYRVQQGIYRCQFTDDSAESVFVGLYRDTSTGYKPSLWCTGTLANCSSVSSKYYCCFCHCRALHIVANESVS